MTAKSPVGVTNDRIKAAPKAPTVDFRQGGRTYFVASIFAQVAALLRYVILARLLGPEQLGLATMLVVTGAFFDMISDTGADRFLIQDRDGDTVAVQKVVHVAYIGRGFMIAAGLLIAAVPVSYFFRAPQIAVGLAILALSPFILGFMHLDLRRVQRRHDFRPEALCLILSEGASVIATSIAAFLTRDFTAILYGLITRAAVMVVVSHMRAERPYDLGWFREPGARLARFAAPVMLSGVMLFLGSQGDRALVGRQLGVVALGRYSAVLLLVYYPSAMLLRYMHAVFLPMIAAERDNPASRDRVSDRLGGQTQLLALGMSVGFAIVATPMVTVLYGAKFTESALNVALIGILQTTRFLINWPTTVAVSMGHSRTVLISNTARLLVFPSALVGYRLLGGLTGVLGGFVVGEMISIVVALALVNRNTGHRPLRGFDRFALFVLASAAIIIWVIAFERQSILIGSVDFFVSLILLACVVDREKDTLQDMIAVLSRLRHSKAWR